MTEPVYIEVVTFLAVKVGDVYGDRCPICAVKFAGHNRKPGVTAPLTARSKAHLEDTRSRKEAGRYIIACRKCNEDQGLMSMERWAEKLERNGDRRAPAAAAVAKLAEEFMKVRKERYGT